MSRAASGSLLLRTGRRFPFCSPSGVMPHVASSTARTLSLIALVSGLYDFLLGIGLLAAPSALAGWFGVAAPEPPIFGTLNGLFLVAIGLGYWLPYRDPVRHRGYLWIMGPLLKGGGAAAFVVDVVLRDSPGAFLLFAASDGSLALITLWALMRRPG